jgi:hypothetical protein
MNYPIPSSAEEVIALRHNPIDEELVAAAIAGVVQIARSQGQSLAQLTAEVLAEDTILDKVQRMWLSELIAQAWEKLP